MIQNGLPGGIGCAGLMMKKTKSEARVASGSKKRKRAQAEEGAWEAPQNKGWPRDTTILHHSPLFFAENKDRFLRQLLIRDIQNATQRPLVVYFASPFFRASIRNEDVRRLYEVIEPYKNIPFDLLIETAGGETDATEGIVSLLQKHSPGFRAIVPLRAKSNGTLICLAADEIVMGPTSELGPIEPSVEYVPVSILRHPEYAGKDVRMKLLGEFAYDQTRSLAVKLLTNGMMRDKSKKEIERTVEVLCTRKQFASHGSVISVAEAQEIGLNASSLNNHDDLWKKFFLLHCMYSTDSTLRGVSKYFEQQTFSHSVVGDDPPFEFD